MKLRIISDGTRVGTRVVNADTGVMVENVVCVEWQLDGKVGVASALLHLEAVAVDLEAVAVDLTLDEGQVLKGPRVSEPRGPAGGTVPAGTGDIHVQLNGYLTSSRDPVSAQVQGKLQELMRGRKDPAAQEAIEKVDIRGLAPSPGFPALIAQPDIHIFYREWAQGGEVTKELTYPNERIAAYPNERIAAYPNERIAADLACPVIKTCPHCNQKTMFGNGPLEGYRCGGCERLVG